jgi:S-formylglutathione hydrolase FrmB
MRFVICLSVFLWTFFSSFVTSGTYEIFEVQSDAMHKSILNTVILPANYKSGNLQYPVIYLLHGAGGDHTDWLKAVPELIEYVSKYNVIAVCPNAEKTSWYLNSPIDPKFQYETYINKELIQAVEKKYRVKSGEEYRGITGFSMGGHGALYSAFKNPDLWDYAASISGGVDLRPFKNNWDIPLRLGEYSSHRNNWDRHSVVNLVHEEKDDPFEINIIVGDNDFFLPVNQDLVSILDKQKINHSFSIIPGGHNWIFCRKVIEFQFMFFSECFN